MFKTAKPTRDAFTLSLGGLRTIASFTAAPGVANDKINQAWDERLGANRGHSNRYGHDDMGPECCPEPA